jgi:uncharacterized protein HemX
MSESDENEKVVVGGADKPPAAGLAHVRKGKLWVVVLAVVVVFLGAAVGLWMTHRTNKVPPAKHYAPNEQINDVQSQAEKTAQTKGSAAGLDVYKQAIASTTDQKTKGTLELEAASQALSSGDVTTALNYALQADAILHTADSSSYVADIYKQQGDNTDAIKYYQLAAKEVNPKRLAGDSSDFYLNEAQALSGAKQ